MKISFRTFRHWKATMEYHRTKNILHVAKDVKEACALIEVGFEYVTGEYNDGGKIFRKRK